MTITTTPPAPVLREHRIPADGLYEGPRELRRVPEGLPYCPYELFRLVPLGRIIGAEIHGVDLSRPLEAALRAELDRALLEWKVLFFRDQHLTSRQQRAFARHWGELETNPLLATGDDPEVARLDRTAVPTFENIWHADVTFRERPASARSSSSARSRRWAATRCGRTWPPRTTTSRPR